MRKRLANFLRRMAGRLDPKPPPEPVVPIELHSTEALAREIAKRSDIVILFWARDRTTRPDVVVPWEMGVLHRINRQGLAPVLNMVHDSIDTQLREASGGA